MKPEHVEELPGGGHMCRSCGGIVGEDGIAPMGEAEEFENFEGSDTDQHEAGERMHEDAFSSAVRKMAMGGPVETETRPLTLQEKEAQKNPAFNGQSEDERKKDADAFYGGVRKDESTYAEEMKRKKAERYGRQGRR